MFGGKKLFKPKCKHVWRYSGLHFYVDYQGYLVHVHRYVCKICGKKKTEKYY